MTSTLNSPTGKKIISEFVSRYPNVEHIEYDSISESATLDAHELMYGLRAHPSVSYTRLRAHETGRKVV